MTTTSTYTSLRGSKMRSTRNITSPTALIRRAEACSLPWAGSLEAGAPARLVKQCAQPRGGGNGARAVAVHLFTAYCEKIAVAHRAQRAEAAPERLPGTIARIVPGGDDDLRIGGEHRLGVHQRRDDRRVGEDVAPAAERERVGDEMLTVQRHEGAIGELVEHVEHRAATVGLAQPVELGAQARRLGARRFRAAGKDAHGLQRLGDLLEPVRLYIGERDAERLDPVERA